MYVVVRRDLCPAQQAVQACHACITSARSFPVLDDHPHLVLLGVADEAALQAVRDRLARTRLPFECFHEPDLGGQATALATGPVYGPDRAFFRDFQLLRGG